VAKKVIRMPLLFTSGPLFYLFFNLRLFFQLLFRKADLMISNDLDTLAPNFIVSRLKQIPLIYDSHEIFTEVPELTDQPLKKKIWKKVESLIIPRLNYCITVNESIAKWFYDNYQKEFLSVRNVPPSLSDTNNRRSRKELNLPEGKKIVLLQGAGININRGAEDLVEAMKFTDESIVLLIIGGGDVLGSLMEKSRNLTQCGKIIFKEKMPPTELRLYTQQSDLGVTIDKPGNLNYELSLPNKIFDYLHAGIPVIASRLKEVEKIIQKYNVGTFIEHHHPEHIAKKITEALNSSEYATWKKNTWLAGKENNWEMEQEKWRQLLEKIEKGRI
jgi:glycosyltransferase involved in cell wall biosynthesis